MKPVVPHKVPRDNNVFYSLKVTHIKQVVYRNKNRLKICSSACKFSYNNVEEIYET